MIKKSLLTPFFAIISLSACNSTTAPPTVPPADFSTFPALSETGYAETTITRVFPMSLTELRSFLDEDNRIVANFEPTEEIAMPVETVYFDGQWPEVGATRRVEQDDGHFVLERVLVSQDDRFEYQVWGFTGPVGNNVEHVHGIMEFIPVSERSTQMNWSYRVKPDAGFKKPFVQRFVNRQVEPFLTGSLDKTLKQAEARVAMKIENE